MVRKMKGSYNLQASLKAELSPEAIIVLDSMCDYYEKAEAEVIEMALMHFAATVQTITQAIEAVGRQKEEGK